MFKTRPTQIPSFTINNSRASEDTTFVNEMSATLDTSANNVTKGSNHRTTNDMYTSTSCQTVSDCVNGSKTELKIGMNA